MEIEYKSKKLKRECEDPKIAQKEYGSLIGSKLTQRVTELTAATSLLDIKYIPSARLHRLKGKRSEQYAIDIIGPFRLVFSPKMEPSGDIIELKDIVLIRIEEVVDYHGKQKQ